MLRVDLLLLACALSCAASACGSTVDREDGSGDGEHGGSDDDDGDGPDPETPPACHETTPPVELGRGTWTSGSNSPSVPYFAISARGEIVFEDPDVGFALEATGARIELESNGDPSFSPSGRFLVVPLLDAHRVIDRDGGPDAVAPVNAWATSFWRAADGGDRVAFIADGEIWTAGPGSAALLAADATRFDAAPRGSVAITEDWEGHRVIDLEAGSVRDLGRGDGVADVSADGTIVTFILGRSTSDHTTSLAFVDTATLETLAEVPYVELDLGYYRAPLHAAEAGHAIAVHRPGGGFSLFGEDRVVHVVEGGELVALLGESEGVLVEGATVVIADAVTGDRRTVASAITPHPWGLLDSDGTVVSHRSRALAFSAILAGVPSVVVVRAGAETSVVIDGGDPEAPPDPRWVSDRGDVLVGGNVGGVGDFSWLHLVDPSGAVVTSFPLEGYEADAFIERENVLIVRKPGYPGFVVEIDRTTGAVRTLATGDALALADDGVGCAAAIALGCDRGSPGHDQPLIIDWELHRVGVGGPVPGVLDPCDP